MITNPAVDITNCVVWLDASDTTTLFQLSGGTTPVTANSDPVGYWGDKSGNGRHFTNIGGSASTRPTWISSLSTVRFDGNNNYLSSFFNLTYTAQTVFVVVSQKLLTLNNPRVYTQATLAAMDNNTASPGQYIPCRINSTSLLYESTYLPSSGGTTTLLTANKRGLNVFDIVTSMYSSVSGIIFSNGVDGNRTSATLNLPVVISRLGGAVSNSAYGATNSFLNGDICEVIVYNKALSNTERADVEYYLTKKWNFLNTIPRQVYAIRNGNWSDTNTWSTSGYSFPFGLPLSADSVYSNTFTVTADSSARVDTLQNTALSPNVSAGGSFILANGTSLSSQLASGTSPYVLTTLPNITAAFVGNITAPNTTSVPLLSVNNSTLTVFGNCKNGTTTINTNSNLTIYGEVGAIGSYACIINNGNLTVYGSVTGNADGGAVNGVITNNGTLNIFGNVVGTSTAFRQRTVMNNSVANVVGNVSLLPSIVSGATSTNQGGVIAPTYGATCTVSITGNVGSRGITTGQFGSYNARITGNVVPESDAVTTCISDDNPNATTTVAVINGNISSNSRTAAVQTGVVTLCGSNTINAPNGRQAIYSPKILMFPGASAAYTRHAVNGYDSYVDYWTSDATFTYPASSDVVLNTTYKNNTLTGTVILPPLSSVYFGVPCGSAAGTAIMTLNDAIKIFDTNVLTLTATNSIGSRLKNIATTKSVSAIANTFNYS